MCIKAIAEEATDIEEFNAALQKIFEKRVAYPYVLLYYYNTTTN